MDLVLAIATILGGVTAIWFLVEKARTIRWGRVRFNRNRKTLPQRSEGISPSGDPQIAFTFPPELETAVRDGFSQHRLPTTSDLQHDWAE